MIPTFIKGFLMGAADVVPGVSGGTVALIVGIYTQLIDSIKNITPKKVWDFLLALLFCWDKSKFSKIKSAGQSLNLNFLLPLGLGIGTAIIIASKYIPAFIKSHPQESDALFFGLILASIYVPYSKINNSNFFHFIFLLIIALLAFNLIGMSNFSNSNHSLIKVFSTGAVAICAMILPGLSGAYIMKVLGEYVYVLDNLHKALKLNWDSLLIITIFILGIIIGLALFSRILSWMLHHYESLTMAGLAGLMLGALRSVWPYDNALPTSLTNHDFNLLLYFFLGIGVTFALIYFDHAFRKE